MDSQVDLKDIALNAPLKSGVYLWRDESKVVIYVGKAKNLRNRLASYFRGPQTIKTMCLKLAARSIEYITTEDEYEAFLLENTLIKKFSPRYNIALKDDKTYPVLAITNEEFPKVIKTRRPNLFSEGDTFGPFPVVGAMDDFLVALYALFPLRRCKKFRKKKEPCLYYHMGQCLAPCVHKDTKPTLTRYIEQIKDLLNGNRTNLESFLKSAASKGDFETALKARNLLNAHAALLAENDKTLFETQEYIDHIAVTIDKTVAINAMLFDAKSEWERWKKDSEDPGLKALKTALGLSKLPRRIEGFDIAHIDGLLPVASLISFWNGRPDKKNYRYFRLKTTDGLIDDFQSMREATARRYTRLINEGKDLPDLVLIDGGIGQVNAVQGVFDALDLKIPIVGLAKKEELLYRPHTSTPITLSHDNDGLRLLVRVRDETHRFATSKNQTLRTKRATDA